MTPTIFKERIKRTGLKNEFIAVKLNLQVKNNDFSDYLNKPSRPMPDLVKNRLDTLLKIYEKIVLPF